MPARSRFSKLSALAGIVAVAILALAVFAFVTPSRSSYLLLPDDPHELAPLVDVPGGRESGAGELYFVDVVSRRATLAEHYLPFLRRDAELVSRKEISPGNIDDDLRRRLDAAAMERSKEIAAAVALRELGYEVVARPSGNFVEQTVEGSPAASKLRYGDVIVAVDGKPSLSFAQLQKLIRRHDVGDQLTLTILRNEERRSVTLRTYGSSSRPPEPLIGVSVGQDAEIELPLDVEIDAGNVVGPSAGLAFALEIADELGRDVDRGRRIAATGELIFDGAVLPVGGIEQKVVGAREAGIEIMLVPAGDNTREARRYAGEMQIISVSNYQQALRALATLPARK